MMLELMRLVQENDEERRLELQAQRMGARRLRARRREQRRTEEALMELAWSRLC
ncbi:hypothetical protein GCM10007147_08740 [Nocardiopsis kunsanensis]|uniref:Uncharacterized protein n=2 Tax=Nocardiopsis kunsanensis TaxID=141693 RepID=A0A918X8T7_9ACTN|nr:hypothetical protein [Nocardiopsis kunsanensis]GHD18488.1 hypothetical protein GCM10007147_08740 [Nocardiopsis kunsanensis]